MTVSKAWPLQQAVYAIVTAAASGLKVFDHVPLDPPEEFIRLEGFSFEDDSPKHEERGRHVFEVHHFTRPVASTTFRRGQKAGKLVLADIHAALMVATFFGQPLQHETMDFAPDTDGVTVHGRSRYSVIL